MIKKNKDQLEIKKTGDGSRTLYVPALGESYHSHFGAVNESLHVFVKAGFNFISGKRKHIRLLEIGLGTGLNALLTYFEAEKKNIKVRYTGLEPDPLDPILVSKLDYPGFIGYSGAYSIFDLIHAAKWEILTPISDKFDLVKSCSELENFFPGRQRFDLVYFDAFSPSVQPELWTLAVFEKISKASDPGCTLVTYSSKGQVRRNMERAGFKVERLPGPEGKREMLRAVKQ